MKVRCRFLDTRGVEVISVEAVDPYPLISIPLKPSAGGLIATKVFEADGAGYGGFQAVDGVVTYREIPFRTLRRVDEGPWA